MSDNAGISLPVGQDTTPQSGEHRVLFACRLAVLEGLGNFFFKFAGPPIECWATSPLTRDLEKLGNLATLAIGAYQSPGS